MLWMETARFELPPDPELWKREGGPSPGTAAGMTLSPLHRRLSGVLRHCPYISSSTNSTHLNSNSCVSCTEYNGMLIFHGRVDALGSDRRLVCDHIPVVPAVAFHHMRIAVKIPRAVKV